MSKRLVLISSVLTLLAVLLSACFSGIPISNLPDANGLAETAAVQTVAAKMTESAFEALVMQLTQISQGTSTPTPLPATETPWLITATPQAPTLTPTNTKTFLPLPTFAPPTVTNTPAPCNWIQFVDDVTVGDGTAFEPNTDFTKTWRLKNIGACTWSDDFKLVFINGDAMGGPVSQEIGETVEPGETIDISVDLEAPDDEGEYTGYWKLKTTDGDVFGWGPNAGKSFWVDIKVEEESVGKMDSDHPLDFSYNVCEAVWRNSKRALACPSEANDYKNGSITRTSKPRLEGGYQDDETSLIMIPNDGDGGVIYGTYPAIKIKDGDHFKALAGCYYDNEDCDALLQLNYINDDGDMVLLDEWEEEYDNEYTEINVNLSELAGEKVQLVLLVHNNGDSEDDKIFWMVPRISR
jgi:hypothetical protein